MDGQIIKGKMKKPRTRNLEKDILENDVEGVNDLLLQNNGTIQRFKRDDKVPRSGIKSRFPISKSLSLST